MGVDQQRFATAREQMITRQLRARGIRSPRVLDAMRAVAREHYLPESLAEFAYADTALPIEEQQTISQPYIVALMLDALDLRGGERVLEIGTGSGYAAAVLAQLAGEVFTIERHERLAAAASERLARDGLAHVHVRVGDGTLGWPDAAPFDAIVVTAGGPRVPDALRDQLAAGGRMVIPVGADADSQHLVRVTRDARGGVREERLAPVRFVPLVGAQGWAGAGAAHATEAPAADLPAAIARAAEPFGDADGADLAPLLARIGDARVVLLGEATHGTSEFYRFRDRVSRALIERLGFDVVAVEADWPDAARIDHFVRDRAVPRAQWQAFARFPTWMWRNREFATFVDWLRTHNLRLPHERRVRFAGLDLYALHTSIAAVLQYLDRVDPRAAAIARHRYGCLTPWQRDPAAYGGAVLTGDYRSCEADVVAMLSELLERRVDDTAHDEEQRFEAEQNARLVRGAERYYRTMFYGSHESWNLRDTHMFDCLQQLLAFHGERSRAIVWAHNSHLGDARATEMAARGEHNLGQLCRENLPHGSVYSVGFGTDHGTVAAATDWDGPMRVARVRPSHRDSYERLCHDSGVPAFLLPLRTASAALRDALARPRLQRAIGVVYRPDTERASHYFEAELPAQFDEYVWIDATTAVTPLATHGVAGVPDTWPFGL